MDCRLASVAVCVGLAFATRPVAAQAEHTIVLTRPVAVGDRFHVSAESSMDIDMTVVTGGRSENVTKIQMSVTFDSAAQVIKIDELGRPIGIAYTINECTVTRHGRTTNLIPEGATLIARLGAGETTFFVKKMRFDEMQRAALETVAGLDGYRATKDQLFGSSRPRRVGEEWSIDVVALAAEFQPYTAHKVSPEDFKGRTSLAEIIEYEGQTCQVIRTKIVSRGVMPTSDRAPPGTRIKEASIEAQILELLPIDSSKPRLADKLKLRMHAVYTGRARGQAMEARMKASIESQHTFSRAETSQAAANPQADGIRP